MNETGPIDPLEAILSSVKEKAERLTLAEKTGILSALLHQTLTQKAFNLLAPELSIELRGQSFLRERRDLGEISKISYHVSLSLDQEGQKISLPLVIEFFYHPASFYLTYPLILRLGDRQEGQAVYVIYPPRKEELMGKYAVSLGAYSFWKGQRQVVEEKSFQEIKQEEYSLLEWISRSIVPELWSPSPETPPRVKVGA